MIIILYIYFSLLIGIIYYIEIHYLLGFWGFGVLGFGVLPPVILSASALNEPVDGICLKVFEPPLGATVLGEGRSRANVDYSTSRKGRSTPHQAPEPQPQC